jgi:4-amino-4-deoxy-L-arabinose transferase-like glycosyltransferase
MLGDGADYYAQAVQLFDGSRPDVPFYWPPGTSYFLELCFWLFGVGEASARLGLAVLARLNVALVSRLAFDITASRRSAHVAAWLAALYPPDVLLSCSSFSQYLSLFCLTGTAVFGYRLLKSCAPRFACDDEVGCRPLRPECRPFDRARGALLTGAFLGVGCLTRPSLMAVVALVPVAAAVAWWWTWRGDRRRGAMRFGVSAAATCAVAFAVALPVIRHNVRTGGGFTLSTNNERNVFLGNNPFTPHYKTGHFAQRSLEELPADVQNYLRGYYESENPRQAMKQAAMTYIREHPGITLLRTANRARAFWGFDYIGSRQFQQAFGLASAGFYALLAVEAGGYAAVMLLAIAGLVLTLRRLPIGGTLWLLGLIAASAAPYCLAFSAGAYHFPTMGLVIPFAACGCVSLTDGTWREIVRRRTFWIGLAAFLVIQIEYAWFSLRHAG